MPICEVPPEIEAAVKKRRFLDELQTRFSYHAPKGDQAERYGKIREAARVLAVFLVEDVQCPDSRELSTALTKLDEVVFWANASIARRE